MPGLGLAHDGQITLNPERQNANNPARDRCTQQLEPES